MYETVEEANEKAYQYIGLFEVNFQKIVYQLQLLIKLTFNSLGPERIHIIEIFFANRTANDIAELARGIFNQTYKPEKEEKAISAKLFKDIIEFIPKRNDLIHGFWHIGFTHEGQTDFSEIGYENIKRKKDGVLSVYDNKKIEHIKTEAETAYKLASEVFQLNMFFLLGYKSRDVPISLADYIEKEAFI